MSVLAGMGLLESLRGKQQGEVPKALSRSVAELSILDHP